MNPLPFLAGLPVEALDLLAHSAVWSFIAWTATACLHHPRARAAAASLGLLAAAVLPWTSALARPKEHLPAALRAPAEALPVWHLDWPVADSSSPAVAATPSDERAEAPAASPPLEPWQVLALLWLPVTCTLLLRDAIAAARLRTWRTKLKAVDDDEWRRLSPFVTLPRSRVLLTDTETSPCVAGVFTSFLIVPRFLLDPARRQPLQWALAHESEHLRGHDLLWLAAFRMIRSALWWNPFIHSLIGRWAEAREQICDLRAAAPLDDRPAYSDFLVSLANRSPDARPGTLAIARRRPFVRLRRRVSFLLTNSADRPAGKRFVVGAAATVVACHLVLPTFGGETVAPDQLHAAIAGASLGSPRSKAGPEAVNKPTPAAPAAPAALQQAAASSPRTWRVTGELFDIPENRMATCRIPEMAPGRLGMLGNYSSEAGSGKDSRTLVGITPRKLPAISFSQATGTVSPWKDQLPGFQMAATLNGLIAFNFELGIERPGKPKLKDVFSLLRGDAGCIELPPAPGFKRRLLFLTPSL